jgi:formamidopyrimidine-DNA glycosylase
MPELPEVETIRSRLAPGLTGRTFESVEILDPRLTRPEPPELVANALEGERVADVRRRGKYLVVVFESGRHLLVHLRMTGNVLHPAPEGREDDPHVRAVVRLDDGSDVLTATSGASGTWDLHSSRELDAYFASRRLGVEPLGRSFTATAFARSLAGRGSCEGGPPRPARSRRDQEHLCGRGALVRTRFIRSPAGELGGSRWSRSGAGCGRLQLGIRRQGATLRDYRGADGSPRPHAARVSCLRARGVP